jgi:GTP cyclohydrolase I
MGKTDLEKVERAVEKVVVLEAPAKIELAARHYRNFMKAAGLPLAGEAGKTPERVARMFVTEFCSHNGHPPAVALFDARGYDQYVVERDIRFSSLCSHHHLPFAGSMCVGYHPKRWLAGLSKIPRVIRYFAARPQLQEHLATEVAEYLYRELQPYGLLVVVEGLHSCMQCRGVMDPQTRTITSKLLGNLDKHEMLTLMKGF